MESKKMKELKGLRLQVSSSIQRFQTFMNTCTDQTDVNLISLRLSSAHPLLKQFDDIQSSIELLDDSEYSIPTRSLFEDIYYTCIAKAQSLINATRKAVIKQDDTKAIPTHAFSQIRLPKVEIQPFSGSYDAWISFSDLFKSMIHDDEALSPIQKFYYLKSSLRGEASRVIESLQVTATNYIVAWDLLKSRYDNKRLTIQSHIKSLFELHTVKNESHSALRQLLNELLTHMRALKALGQPTDKWDSLIVHLISTKLDFATRREWEKGIEGVEPPTFAQLEEFLNKRCQILESMAINKQTGNAGQRFQSSQIKHSASHSHVAAETVCPICKQNHYVFQCEKFKKQSVSQRITQVKDKRLCINCMKPNHKATDCNSSRCRKCNGLHNTLLHLENLSSSTQQRSNSPINNSSAAIPSASTQSHYAYQPASQIILGTAKVIVYDNLNNPHVCRALIDNGSQSNFITEKLVKKLKLNQRQSTISVTGINNHKSNCHNVINLQLKSRFNSYQANLECLVTSRITNNLPNTSFSKDLVPIPNTIKLADPEYNISREIELLIGLEIYNEILCVGQIKPTGKHLPYLQKTQLGWIVSGKLAQSQSSNQTTCFISSKQIDESITRFWKLEEYKHNNHVTLEEKYCEDLFQNSTSRTPEGRFMVSLPIKSNAPALGESYTLALKRFYNLERKLEKNSNLYAEYKEFIKEYLFLGHMKEIKQPYLCNKTLQYFLPHHAVLNEASSTTRLRVVFDGSAKTSNNISLNDILCVGPVMQQDLSSIIMRFRTHLYVMIADITKMYRQILVNPNMTPLQRILWRNEKTNKIQIYELSTLTYGTAPASYLATRCLVELANQYEGQYPCGAEIIKRDFYVDDLLSGANTIEEALKIQREVIAILKTGGFELKKWATNNCQLMEHIENKQEPNVILNLDKSSTIKTLGIHWDSKNDSFQYSIPEFTISKSITKRIILSNIAQVFDPLGLISPVVIIAKILMQELWKCDIGWDETIPVYLHTAWLKYQSDIQGISRIRIPRKVTNSNGQNIFEIHGFCDASERAYGACLYIRSGKDEASCTSHLLCAKSRVAPLKATTLPRLELCAAVLLVELIDNMHQYLSSRITAFYYWSDSTITLSWIKQESRNYKTFVANRIAIIQDKSMSTNWNHISTKLNPADFITRGKDANSLVEEKLWWNGPQFLIQPKLSWNINHHINEIIPTEELKTNNMHTFHANITMSNEIFEKFSSLRKLQRVVAIMLRFIHNCKNKNNKRSSYLSVSEIEEAEKLLIRNIQTAHFFQEITALQNKKDIKKDSKILRLCPFLDNDGLLRVGGRLKLAVSLSYANKHPIILPADHNYSNLISRCFHEKLLHAGIQGTMAAIREKYWIISGKNLVKKIIKNCIVCFRHKPLQNEYLMGQLPATRIEPSRPFLNTGVDYAGPFSIREKEYRSRKCIKSYAAVFVCFSTKAVHIELVHDLTTQSFIAALKRFVARRGRIANLYSDNATNFVGANKELQELHEIFQAENKELATALNNEHIQWHFIPSRSPNYGGLWEAAVKSMKHHLRRVTCNITLSYVELYTLLTQIESILNSRPLTSLSDDPNDFSTITPGHFLIGDSLTAIPEPSLDHIPVSRLSRWQHIQLMREHFWKRWQKEYLTLLQQRNKWFATSNINLQTGQLVLLKDENTPPQHWIRGRIRDIHPGIDGIVRAVTVQLSNKSTTRRAATRVVVLPLKDNDFQHQRIVNSD